jgi:hypothetical protein
MGEWQTEAEFTKNLNTTFRVQLDGAKPIDLTLVAVTPRHSGANEAPGMERFSALFSGPPDLFLPQQCYRITHDDMGEFEVFLVPIAREKDGFKYEAVYNYFKESAQ